MTVRPTFAITLKFALPHKAQLGHDSIRLENVQPYFPVRLFSLSQPYEFSTHFDFLCVPMRVLAVVLVRPYCDVSASAADAVSLKLVKHGGMLAAKRVAAIAAAAGLRLYGGCLLESSVGAAAHLQLFSTFHDLPWGIEHFGPQILVEDIVETPLKFEDFQVLLPEGPGIGVVLDYDKVRRFSRS